MIDLRIQSIISSLEILIEDNEFTASKKGFGNTISKTLFSYAEDLRNFIRTGVHDTVRGYIKIDKDVIYIDYNNVIESINIAIDYITEELENKYELKTHNFEIYCTDAKYGVMLKDTKTFNQMIRFMNITTFTEFKIYTDCGLKLTYHDIMENCRITMIQYSNKEINLLLKYPDKERIQKLINYHLKHFNQIN